MILEANIIETKPGAAEAFKAAFDRARPLLAAVPGCGSIALLHSLEWPERFIVQIEWDCIESHVDRYPTTPQAAMIRGLLAPHIAHMVPGHFSQGVDRQAGGELKPIA